MGDLTTAKEAQEMHLTPGPRVEEHLLEASRRIRRAARDGQRSVILNRAWAWNHVTEEELKQFVIPRLEKLGYQVVTVKFVIGDGIEVFW